MPRQYDLTIPPEYQVMSTQVTQYGEPIMPDVNPAAMGSFGRRPQDADDAKQIGMQPEVWEKGKSPLATAQKGANSYTAWLRHITRTGQVNAAEVTEREGGSKVTYNATGADEQVSNVKGLRVTGDPDTVSGALRNATSSSFSKVAPVDAERAVQSAHRNVRNMPEEHKRAFHDVLMRDPSALQSLAPTALAGIDQSHEMVDESGAARPFFSQIEDSSNPADFQNVLNHAARKQTFAVNSRPAATYHPAQSNYEDSYGLTNTTMGALSPAEQQGQQAAQRNASNRLARANAMKANLTSRWQQQMIASNNAARNGQMALAKQRAQEAANTQRQLAHVNADVNQASAQARQFSPMSGEVSIAGLGFSASGSASLSLPKLKSSSSGSTTQTSAAGQGSTTQTSAAATSSTSSGASPDMRMNQVIVGLTAARPEVRATFELLKKAQQALQTLDKVKKQLLPDPLKRSLLNVEVAFDRARGAAKKVKIASERNFVEAVVLLERANFKVYEARLTGKPVEAAKWAIEVRKLQAKIAATLAIVFAALDAAKKQQPASGASASLVSLDLQALQVVQALSNARPAVKKTLSEIAAKRFQQAAATAATVKAPAERLFTQDLVAFGVANHMITLANQQRSSADAAKWTAEAQKLATKIKAAAVKAIAAIQAETQKQQTATLPKTATLTAPSTPSTPSTPKAASGGLTKTANLRDSFAAKARAQKETVTDASSAIPQSASFQDVSLTPGGQAWQDTGSQLAVSEEYVKEDGTVDPLFAQGGLYDVNYADSRYPKGLKVALTLGLIAAAGTGLYIAAKG